MTPVDELSRSSEVLVTSEWLADHLDDPGIRVIESNEDPLVYSSGHIPGAVEIDWMRDLNDPLSRDYLDADRFKALVEGLGISGDTMVVFYGDRNNWWAAYAFWVFQLFGHKNARILDGGRLKWLHEERPLTRKVPEHPPGRYSLSDRDDEKFRAMRNDVLHHLSAGGRLVDVRSAEEYRGERLHLPEYPNEGAVRGGHIPGAQNVQWARNIREDGTFKSAEELRAIYCEEQGLEPQDEVIVYCRIGERSAHTWFVLKYLLGFTSVRNYDGSWTEWGNLVGAPIEK